jgi:hypothetical protein
MSKSEFFKKTKLPSIHFVVYTETQLRADHNIIIGIGSHRTEEKLTSTPVRITKSQRVWYNINTAQLLQ